MQINWANLSYTVKCNAQVLDDPRFAMFALVHENPSAGQLPAPGILWSLRHVESDKTSKTEWRIAPIGSTESDRLIDLEFLVLNYRQLADQNYRSSELDERTSQTEDRHVSDLDAFRLTLTCSFFSLYGSSDRHFFKEASVSASGSFVLKPT